MTPRSRAMTEEQLAKAEAAYRAASQHAEQLREKRNALISRALAAGWTHARISQVTGLSRGRISQIRCR